MKNKVKETAKQSSLTHKRRDTDTAAAIVAKPDAQDDPVFAQYGEPFITNDKGQVHLNERAVAVKCASEHLVKYDPGLRTYERYAKDRGLWVATYEVEVRRLLADLLMNLGDDWHQQEFVQRNKNSQFNSLAKMLQLHHANIANEDVTGLFHVGNGVLDLRGKTPKLLLHDPKRSCINNFCISGALQTHSPTCVGMRNVGKCFALA